ncbi:MAG: PAS domain-containing protein [Rhodoblastus sp.]
MFHDLRGTAATRLAKAGATEIEIADLRDLQSGSSIGQRKRSTAVGTRGLDQRAGQIANGSQNGTEIDAVVEKFGSGACRRRQKIDPARLYRPQNGHDDPIDVGFGRFARGRQNWKGETGMTHDELAGKILDGLPDALVVSDRDGLIAFWNAGAERIFGFSQKEALGQSLDIITPERLRSRHWAGYHETMRSGKTKYGAGDLLSVPALRKDGGRISVQFSILPLHDGTGALAAIAAIMRDVTADFEERKKLRQMVMKSDGRRNPPPA